MRPTLLRGAQVNLVGYPYIPLDNDGVLANLFFQQLGSLLPAAWPCLPLSMFVEHRSSALQAERNG